MISFVQGNLLDSKSEALVNTVNTVGVMGKGVALMFKEAFPENYELYRAACRRGEVRIGRMFATERDQLIGPKWIINFPTKEHWRSPSKLEWIEAGLEDLRRVIRDKRIRSVALPPLGSGQGGLNWRDVRSTIHDALGSLPGVEVIVYEPTAKYQNVAKRHGVEALTPARGLIAELVRRYWLPGLECTILEIQKLAYFLERRIEASGLRNPLNLQFRADKFGPYAPRLGHLLNSLDGSYLHCDRRLPDAGLLDVIWFNDAKKDKVAAYLTAPEVKPYREPLDSTSRLIDGFQSPLGMELLATVDWLHNKRRVEPTIGAVRKGLESWPGGNEAGKRKLKLFDERLIGLALERLAPPAPATALMP